jgi:hypothetical protein
VSHFRGRQASPPNTFRRSRSPQWEIGRRSGSSRMNPPVGRRISCSTLNLEPSLNAASCMTVPQARCGPSGSITQRPGALGWTCCLMRGRSAMFESPRSTTARLANACVRFRRARTLSSSRSISRQALNTGSACRPRTAEPQISSPVSRNPIHAGSSETLGVEPLRRFVLARLPERGQVLPQDPQLVLDPGSGVSNGEAIIYRRLLHVMRKS